MAAETIEFDDALATTLATAGVVDTFVEFEGVAVGEGVFLVTTAVEGVATGAEGDAVAATVGKVVVPLDEAVVAAATGAGVRLEAGVDFVCCVLAVCLWE